jgi:hypothetical protein
MKVGSHSRSPSAPSLGVGSIDRVEMCRRQSGKQCCAPPTGHCRSEAQCRCARTPIAANTKRCGAVSQSDTASGPETKRRYSGKRLPAHRAKLGPFAANYGRLCGVTGQTIPNWEQEKSRPQAAQVEASPEYAGSAPEKLAHGSNSPRHDAALSLRRSLTVMSPDSLALGSSCVAWDGQLDELD